MPMMAVWMFRADHQVLARVAAAFADPAVQAASRLNQVATCSTWRGMIRGA